MPVERKYKNSEGVAALLTVVIISAAVLIMAYSSSIMGLGELELGVTESSGQEAFSVADGCMDEALERLRKDSSYTGSYLSTANGSCMISVATVGSNSTTTVSASSTDGYYRKIETAASVSGGVVTVTSWEEKSD